MATKVRGTRPPEDQRLTDAQLEALAEETNLTKAKVQAMAEESAQGRQKLQLAAQQLTQEGQLGREKLSTEERSSRLSAAMVALGLAEKTRAGERTSKQDMFSELIRRQDIPPEALASTLKAGGNPELAAGLEAATAQRRNAFVQSQVPLLTNPKIQSEEARQKAFKGTMEAAFPGSYNEALAAAYPATAPRTAPTTPAVPPIAPVAPANDTDRIAAGLLKAAGYTSAEGERAAPVTGGPPIGPPGTAQLSRILGLKAAGEPYVEGGRVYNQPTGTAGLDFNTNTGEWVPKTTVGTINGVPATEAIQKPVYSNPEVEHGIARVPVAPAVASLTAPISVGQNWTTGYGATRSPTVTPAPTTVLPTPTVTPPPAVSVAPTLTPEQMEAERQRRLREAMLLQTQR